MAKKKTVTALDVFPISKKKTERLESGFNEVGTTSDERGQKFSKIKSLVYAVQCTEDGKPAIRTVKFQLAAVNAIYVSKKYELVIQLEGNAMVTPQVFTADVIESMIAERSGTPIGDDGVIDVTPNRAKRRQLAKKKKKKKSGKKKKSSSKSKRIV